MRLYEITLPLYTNSGDDYDEAHEAWRRKALDVAGGFTQLPDGSMGYWLDGDKLYAEGVRVYRVACEPAQWFRLLEAAFGLFPDQITIFHAEVGDGTITSRDEWRAAAALIRENVEHAS